MRCLQDIFISVITMAPLRPLRLLTREEIA